MRHLCRRFFLHCHLFYFLQLLAPITNGTQVGSVLSPGMKGNHATLKQRLRFTVFGVPSKFTALHYWCQNIWVEINASTSRECLNNPDIKPGAVRNRWIVGIKLFPI